MLSRADYAEIEEPAERLAGLRCFAIDLDSGTTRDRPYLNALSTLAGSGHNEREKCWKSSTDLLDKNLACAIVWPIVPDTFAGEN